MLRGLIKCLEGQLGQPFEKLQLQNQKSVPRVKKFCLTKKLMKIEKTHWLRTFNFDFH